MTCTVSVVTAVFNGRQHLSGCLESVASQRGVAIEHIVIDGGSTDGSVELIRQWADRLSYWCSEPDEGIADAMNKGIVRATGQWVVFLHADDFFHGPSVLADALDRIESQGGADIAGFPVLFGSPPNLVSLMPRRAGPWTNVKMGMCHQGMLTRLSLFSDLGLYDTRYRIDMDYEFVLRAYRGSARIATFASPVLAVMRTGGISSRQGWSSERDRFREERRIHLKHSRSLAARFAYHLYWLMYLPYRWTLVRIRAH